MQKFNERVCVIGLGYIGLPTAALLAYRGYDVYGVDIDPDVVNTINSGGIHIIEPELDKYVKNSVESGLLKAFLDPQPADIYIICVPTPFNLDEEIPTPNLDFVIQAAMSIVDLLKDGDVVILESTSPVGTTHQIRDIFHNKNISVDNISIAYCPERVLPGKIMQELVSNDRIVGGIDDKACHKVAHFYKTFVEGEVLITSAKTAEMCKLAENSFRDVNIAFANELSMVCDTHGIDPWELISLANHHPRVNILQPATGVGGHCIAVDPWFIVSGDQKHARLIKLARQVNNSKTEWVVNKIMKEIENLVEKGTEDPCVACLGISFKPDIDDLRESPALFVVNELVRLNINVIVVEPNISTHNQFSLASFDDALHADLVAILVNHKDFSISHNQEKLLKANVLDFCGTLKTSSKLI